MPAAGGRPAAEFVANQPADGYTLFIAASGVMSVASAIYPKLAYHPTKSFTPLTMIADFPLILVSPVENPAKTVAELVAYAKANPDKANYGMTSPAFVISTELLKLKTGMPGVGIPLKSSAEMVLCVIQQNCLIAISDGPPAIPQIKAGKVRALAVTGAERSPELPHVPSMAEAGYPEVNTKLWSGFFVSAKTPPAIAAKLERALRRAIADPGVNAKLKEMAVNPGGGAVGRVPQDNRRGYPELRRGGQGSESEVQLTKAQRGNPFSLSVRNRHDSAEESCRVACRARRRADGGGRDRRDGNAIRPLTPGRCCDLFGSKCLSDRAEAALRSEGGPDVSRNGRQQFMAHAGDFSRAPPLATCGLARATSRMGARAPLRSSVRMTASLGRRTQA